jgi:hypothetical protein
MNKNQTLPTIDATNQNQNQIFQQQNILFSNYTAQNITLSTNNDFTNNLDISQLDNIKLSPCFVPIFKTSTSGDGGILHGQSITFKKYGHTFRQIA